MSKTKLLYAVCIAALLVSCSFSRQTPPEEASTDLAGRILKESGVKGGLVVHLGCGDGKLTAALGASDRYLVHGLDVNAKNVEKARLLIHESGSYGKVSADRFNGRNLPYADNLVNLVIADDSTTPIPPMGEIIRVLAPNGVAYIRRDGVWDKSEKAWPDTMGQWTHFLHDASNNAVARDSEVGPPRELRWVAGPLWTRSHEFTSSLVAMVSANGRLFYIFDEGLTGVTTPTVPERWMLIARDAFNGLPLWKRPIDEWGTAAWKKKALRSIPQTVPRRIVAEGDRVFMTLGYKAPVSVLNAATGALIRIYPDTEGAEELRCLDGVLVLRKGPNTLMAFDTGPHKKLWEVSGKIQPLTFALHNDRVIYQDGQTLICLSLSYGKELWRLDLKGPVSLLAAEDNHVFLSVAKTIMAVSADKGKQIWTIQGTPGRKEMFAAQGQLWHWQGAEIVGRDYATGEIKTRLDASDVFTPGHHPRCYQSKATENFLITPERGAEFVSLTGAEHTQNDWLRGACRYGIMPCNGLLYVPPNPCFCYPGVKITGFNALAPQSAETSPFEGEPLLQKGPAYNAIRNAKYAIRDDDWPTYRRDARRSGATDSQIPASLSPSWRVKLGGSLAPPVVANGRVYIAAKDKYTLHALDAKDGDELWSFIAGGRIDSPPTVHGGAILFGSADGYVYCLRASDGRLAWRLRAAPTDRKIMAFGRLESPWRVHGSILVRNDLAYSTAGRSSYLDGGIRILAIEPLTGKIRHRATLDTWARTRTDSENKPFIAGYHMEGAQSDILVSEGDSIYLGQAKFNLKLEPQDVPYVMPDPNDKLVAMDLEGQPYTEEDANPDQDYEVHQRDWLERTQKGLLAQLREDFGGYSIGQRQMGRHVFATGGFLDDSWFNRTYWMYSETWPGFYLANRAAKTGQLLVVGPDRTYAVQAFPSRNLQSPLFTPGKRGYLLFADDNDNEPALDHRTRGTTKGWGFTRTEPPVWHNWVPVRIRAMALASDNLFVAGTPDIVDPNDLMGALEGRKGAEIWVFSKTDGKKLAKYRIDSPPVFDGAAAAAGRLFLSLSDGTMLCLGPKR
ncbi:MAG: outer membrane protein assembly factor BamB family protein [Planctomycetota bacterium]|jgi:outer membrane protein assembly factor BamB